MTGYEQFVSNFGDITVGQVISFGLALLFLCLGYRKYKQYLIKKHDRDEKSKAELQEALTGVRNLPEYRKQSLQIQKELKDDNAEVHKTLDKVLERLDKIESDAKQRDRNEVREKLMCYYRKYADLKNNPSQSWTKMESEAFRELFEEYEAKGGNGEMHRTVRPALDKLTVIDE